MAHYLFNHTLRFVPLGYNDPPLFLTPPLHANEANDFTHLRYALCCLISLLCSQAELRKTQLVKEGDKITIFLIIANIHSFSLRICMVSRRFEDVFCIFIRSRTVIHL